MTAIDGVDVSHYQRTVDWAAVKGSGISFAICKASQGVGSVDTYLHRNWAGIHAAGLDRGAYHYATWGDPVAQADWFRHMIDLAGGLVAGDTLWLDLEDKTFPRDHRTVDFAATFLHRLAWGDTGLYTAMSFLDSLGDVGALTAWPLWVARYRGRDYAGQAAATSPGSVAPWPSYAIWQFSSLGTVPGITGSVDVDRYGTTPRTKPAPKPPVLQEDDMPRALRSRRSGATFVVDPGPKTIWKIKSREQLIELYALKLITPDPGNEPGEVSGEFLDDFRTIG